MHIYTHTFTFRVDKKKEFRIKDLCTLNIDYTIFRAFFSKLFAKSFLDIENQKEKNQ